MPIDGTVLMEGVRIIFRNFAGKEGKYNKEGTRNFAVLLDDKIADEMAADGWNIKELQPREEDEDGTPQPYLPVFVRYDVFPPHIVVVTDTKREPVTEEELVTLDWADIRNVDLIVRPHHWEMPGGKTGVKAYVKTMFITIEEDALEAKYGSASR